MNDDEKAKAIANREYFERAIVIGGQTYRHGIRVRSGEDVSDKLIKMMMDDWEQDLRERLEAPAQ